VTDRPATLLAFDYGEKRIGVAVGQTVTGTAHPLRCVRVSSSRPDWRAIEDLVLTWRPDALVVGLPLNMDGTEQAITGAAMRFRRQLEGRFAIPVHAMDERLSTREAKERLYARGHVDAAADPVAAQVILEGWLAEHA
jgi:putative Holliday junction resolvase